MAVPRRGRAALAGRAAPRADGVEGADGSQAGVLDAARYVVREMAGPRCGAIPPRSGRGRTALPGGRCGPRAPQGRDARRAAARASADESVRARVLAA